jgi:hypothetical protein
MQSELPKTRCHLAVTDRHHAAGLGYIRPFVTRLVRDAPGS